MSAYSTQAELGDVDLVQPNYCTRYCTAFLQLLSHTAAVSHKGAQSARSETRREANRTVCPSSMSDAAAADEMHSDVPKPTTATQRPDGSMRSEPPQARPGYVPPDEVQKYEAPRPRRLRGSIIEFDSRRGWGFVRPDDLSANLFLHKEEVLDLGTRMLCDGMYVECECMEQPGERASRAVNVRLFNDLPRKPQPQAGAAKSAQGSTKRALPLVPRAVAAVRKKQQQQQQQKQQKQQHQPDAGTTAGKRPRPSEASVLGYM